MRLRIAWLSVRRLARIARVGGRHGLALALPPRAGRWRWAARLLPLGLGGPQRLQTLLEELGGAFVKFGQMLALQPDILSQAYCDALLKLLDRIEPFPFADADRIFREELGLGLDEAFEDCARRPLATASIGQVYTARLDGKKVAVKIQRPNAELEFRSDIALLVTGMRLIRWLRVRRLYWLLEPTTEFVAWSAEELDYRHEARYAAELRRHAEDNPIQYVPAVEPRFTSRRTLVVEYLEGVTLLAYLRAREEGDELTLRRLQTLGFDRQRFAANIVDNFLGDAFRHGIYHADLHPANLIILSGNVVGYIDFGITGRMSYYSRRHLVAMSLALARGDEETMYHEYLRITSHDARSDYAGFRRELARLSAAWYEESGGERRLQAKITRIFSEILAASREAHVMPERDIVKYIRSAITIDGLLGRFAPGYDIGREIAEGCSRFLRWEARQNLLAPDRLLAGLTAGGRLLLDGPLRVSQALERLAEDNDVTPASRIEGRAGRDDSAERARAVRLAAAVFGVSLLIAAAPLPPALGINLLTAELLFVGTAAVLLGGSLRRLRW